MKFYCWIDHLFWCLGKFYLAVLRLDFKEAADIYYWIRVQLLYKSKKIGRVDIPVMLIMKNGFISLFGMIITGALIGAAAYCLWILIFRIFLMEMIYLLELAMFAVFVVAIICEYNRKDNY